MLLKTTFPTLEELCRATIYSNVPMNVHVIFKYEIDPEMYMYFIYYGRTNEIHCALSNNSEYVGMYEYDVTKDTLTKVNMEDKEKYTPSTKFIYFSEINKVDFIRKRGVSGYGWFK